MDRFAPMSGTSASTPQRLFDFKPKENSHQRRVQQASNLRKARRKQLVSRKRVRLDGGLESIMAGEFFTDATKAEQTDLALHAAAELLRSSAHSSALRKLQRLLSQSAEPPIDAVVEAGVVPKLIHILSASASSEDLLAACWCLTNIAAGSHAHSGLVLEAGPYLVSFLSGTNTVLREQAAWALANVAADGLEYTDAVLELGALHPLVSMLHSEVGAVARTAAFALCQLCRGSAAAEKSVSLGAVAAIGKLVQVEDRDTVIEAVWLLSYLSANNAEAVRQIMVQGTTTILVHMLGAADIFGPEVLVPVIRVIGNIVCCSDDATTDLLQMEGFLGLLGAFLNPSSFNRALRKEVVWLLSNIAGGMKEHLQAVVDANVVPVLLELMRTQAYDIRTEVAYCLINIASERTYLEEMFKAGITEVILPLLRTPNPNVQKMCLDFIAMILSIGPEAVEYVESLDGIDAVESLQFSNNPMLLAEATALVDRYWGDDDA